MELLMHLKTIKYINTLPPIYKYDISTWERHFLHVHSECIERITHINPSVVHKRLKQKGFIHSWFSNNPNRNTLSKKPTYSYRHTYTYICVYSHLLFYTKILGTQRSKSIPFLS